VRKNARFLSGDTKEPEGEKPTCCASQTVKVTVSATANPVHLLLCFLVTLGLAKCTNRTSACLMPRGFYAKVALFKLLETKYLEASMSHYLSLSPLFLLIL
jgi:hypothetical protein